MDPSKCLQILHSRNTATDPEKEEFYKSISPALNVDEDIGISAATTSPDILREMSTLDLMNLFTTLQGERVQVYSDFDTSLKVLSENSRLVEYPNLCAEVTSRFAVLSKQILSIKETFKGRKLDEVVKLVGGIQLLEKTKLMLVAAQHLDIMNLTGEPNTMTLGNLTLTSSETNKQYSDKKMCDVKTEICDAVEMFQSLKCDYVEA